MEKFIDIHTHKPSNSEFVFEIINILLHNQNISNTGYYSIGWHPWFINKNSITEIEEKLPALIQKDNVLALGEIGLDRSIEIPIEIQIEVLIIQLKIAIRHNKPIIIHCVKAYSDLLEILKREKPDIPIILHDFKGNEQIITQFLKYNVYFSFGTPLLKYIPKKVNSLKFIPINKLFLETDESTESIENIYLHTSNLLSVSIEKLKKQINSNFKTVFGDGLVK